ncbi:MAG: 16S rRNA (uracil(1498)-N(3))-methyltransferase [Candidatus Pelagadaptatus aseana]|uniref:16S rRNA (uracil(1498)-N(3))-methyltransferase n=1 Tax=Candidatus Pelagadaptatus aseana TaxID=3120508 RepID=UPI0039B1309A
MNLLLLTPEDLCPSRGIHPMAKIQDRRARHLIQTNRVECGDTVKAGMINGDMGIATIVSIDGTCLSLELNLNKAPPPPLPVTLIMALPRPKMLKRTLQTIATMGVKKLYFINSYRVEKSYWQSPWLDAIKIQEQLILGLEQGCDTQLPQVILNKRFKPFVEDDMPALCQDRRALVAHPYTTTPCPAASLEDTLLVIGPEGGFIPYEVDKLQQAGCEAIHLGDRILRVETAVPVLLAKLFP